jgi:uncharacterized protein (TIGR02145 family)
MASSQWYFPSATPTPDPSNSSGFTATQNGLVLGGGYGAPLTCFWWSSTQSGTDLAGYWLLTPGGISSDYFDKKNYLSVRCLRD